MLSLVSIHAHVLQLQLAPTNSNKIIVYSLVTKINEIMLIFAKKNDFKHFATGNGQFIDVNLIV